MQNQRGLQLKELIFEVMKRLQDGTQCQPYTIDYLRKTNRLTLLRKPMGKGDVSIFSEKAVTEVLNYLNRNNGVDYEE